MASNQTTNESSYLLDQYEKDIDHHPQQQQQQQKDHHQQQQQQQQQEKPVVLYTKPEYSIFRVRLSLLLATIFTLAITKPVYIAQYLLDRLNQEAAALNNSLAGPSVHLCGPLNHTGGLQSEVKTGNEVQAQVSTYLMGFSIVGSVIAFFSCMVFGAIVDVVGRKVALISSSFGSLATAVIVFFIIRYDWNVNLFYIAFTIDGICGSYFVFLIANFAIIADISADKRGRIFWIAAFQAIPFTIQAGCNVGIGYLIKDVGYVATSVVAIIPAAFAFLLAAFVVPETLPVEKQRVTVKKLTSYVRRIVHLYAKDGSKYRRLSMVLSLVIFFVSYVNSMNVSNTDTLYQRRQPLCWNPAQLGHYSAYRALTNSVLGMLFLWGLRQLKFISDEQIAMIGALSTAGGFVLEGLVRKTWQMYLVPLLLFPGFNVTPVTRGVMSSLSGSDQQGVMFSSIALVEVLCMIVASLLYQFYAAMLNVTPGAMYFLMAAIAFVDFILFFPFFYVYKRTT